MVVPVAVVPVVAAAVDTLVSDVPVVASAVASAVAAAVAAAVSAVVISGTEPITLTNTP